MNRHEAAAQAHRDAAARPNNVKNDRAYSATWLATNGNHPDSVKKDLEATYDTDREVAAHIRLAKWHEEQAK
jgi:hypothetical protein